MKDASESLNRAIYEKSGGIIDLWTTIPMALIGLGVYKMLKPGGISVPDGFTLMWWAYMQLFRGAAKS